MKKAQNSQYLDQKGIDWTLLSDTQGSIKAEYLRAKEMHPGMLNGPHEGYAVLLEEVDELWKEVKKKDFDNKAARKEAIQIAAMVIRFINEVCDRR